MVLVGVNLTGYAVGISGLHGFLAKIATLDGFRTGVVTFLYLSVAVCFMNFVARRDNSITSPRAQ
jgi:hypothetical protein